MKLSTYLTLLGTFFFLEKCNNFKILVEMTKKKSNTYILVYYTRIIIKYNNFYNVCNLVISSTIFELANFSHLEKQ